MIRFWPQDKHPNEFRPKHEHPDVTLCNLQVVIIGHRTRGATNPGNLMLICLTHYVHDPRYVGFRCPSNYAFHIKPYATHSPARSRALEPRVGFPSSPPRQILAVVPRAKPTRSGIYSGAMKSFHTLYISNATRKIRQTVPPISPVAILTL